MIDVELIKQLREQTGAGVMDAKSALEETNGNIDAAVKIISEKGLAKTAERADRETKCGRIETYVHGNGSVGVILELNCETSFVANTDEYKSLAHEIALQIASMQPENVDALLTQPYIRDPKTTIGDLIKGLIAKTGENIAPARFSRFALGE